MDFQTKGRLQLKDISEVEAAEVGKQLAIRVCIGRGIKSDTPVSNLGGLLESEGNTGGSED